MHTGMNMLGSRNGPQHSTDSAQHSNATSHAQHRRILQADVLPTTHRASLLPGDMLRSARICAEWHVCVMVVTGV